MMSYVKKDINPFTSKSSFIIHSWLSEEYLSLIPHYHNKMAAIFCKEELDSENGLSSFSLEQLEMLDPLTTVFFYDVEEIINVQQLQNIKGFVMQQCSLLWNSFVHTFWRYLKR